MCVRMRTQKTFVEFKFVQKGHWGCLGGAFGPLFRRECLRAGKAANVSHINYREGPICWSRGDNSGGRVHSLRKID